MSLSKRGRVAGLFLFLFALFASGFAYAAPPGGKIPGNGAGPTRAPQALANSQAPNVGSRDFSQLPGQGSVAGSPPANIGNRGISQSGQPPGPSIAPNQGLQAPDIEAVLGSGVAGVPNGDFLVGRYPFNQDINPGSAVNAGKTTVTNGGLAALVVPGLDDANVIETRVGRVTLGSMHTITLDFFGDDLVSFAVDKATIQRLAGPEGVGLQALLDQSGNGDAPPGRLWLTANAASSVVNGVINLTGLVPAQAASSSAGNIVLQGSVPPGSLSPASQLGPPRTAAAFNPLFTPPGVDHAAQPALNAAPVFHKLQSPAPVALPLNPGLATASPPGLDSNPVANGLLPPPFTPPVASAPISPPPGPCSNCGAPGPFPPDLPLMASSNADLTVALVFNGGPGFAVAAAALPLQSPSGGSKPAGAIPIAVNLPATNQSVTAGPPVFVDTAGSSPPSAAEAGVPEIMFVETGVTASSSADIQRIKKEGETQQQEELDGCTEEDRLEWLKRGARSAARDLDFGRRAGIGADPENTANVFRPDSCYFNNASSGIGVGQVE